MGEAFVLLLGAEIHQVHVKDAGACRRRHFSKSARTKPNDEGASQAYLLVTPRPLGEANPSILFAFLYQPADYRKSCRNVFLTVKNHHAYLSSTGGQLMLPTTLATLQKDPNIAWGPANANAMPEFEKLLLCDPATCPPS